MLKYAKLFFLQLSNFSFSSKNIYKLIVTSTIISKQTFVF
jgi:hypothetical protein